MGAIELKSGTKSSRGEIEVRDPFRRAAFDLDACGAAVTNPPRGVVDDEEEDDDDEEEDEEEGVEEGEEVEMRE